MVQKWKTNLRDRVLERDRQLCICGRYADVVHHIVHRGKATEDLIWREENMICLCNDCHDKANATEAKRGHLEYLRERYGYEYTERPWKGLLA